MQNQNAKTIGLTIVWNNLPPKNIAKPSKINFSKIIVIMPLGCRNTAKRIKKWNEKGLGQFTIKRQESYNYSEMLSGDLDSTKKKGLEEYKKSISEKADESSIFFRTFKCYAGEFRC